MKRILGAVFVFSLGLNAYFVYSNYCSHPNFDFYPTSLKDAYYIRGSNGGSSYLIEHEGQRFTAKCQASLTWLDGTNSLGKPMSSNGTCTYMASMVGKSIAAGLMRHEGNNLVYSPWANSDTVQTADILTITNVEAK
ncbi:MAG: hypothetical protein WBM14_07595 [Terracidiphilus sp.]